MIRHRNASPITTTSRDPICAGRSTTRATGRWTCSISRSVASLTVVSSPADLQARWFNREIAPKTYFGHYFGPKRSKKLHKALQDRRKVIEFYDRWLDFLAGRPGRHHLFSVRDGA